MPEVIWIEREDELAGLAHALERSGAIGLDTEFMRERTFFPGLCLLQLAAGAQIWCVDTLRCGSLDPLVPALTAPGAPKIIHSARQDLEIFYNLNGKVPAPIFDTQVAAMVCGFGESASYETLAGKLAGAAIDKSSRFTDWSSRPLTERQTKYALADVTHLRKVYEKLAAQLDKSGRHSWLDEEMAVLCDPATYRLDPALAWRRLKVRSSNRRMLALVRELAAWREISAQQRNLPRNRLLRDESLLEIAAHAPKNADEMARTRGMGRGFAESKLGGDGFRYMFGMKRSATGIDVAAIG